MSHSPIDPSLLGKEDGGYGLPGRDKRTSKTVPTFALVAQQAEQ